MKLQKQKGFTIVELLVVIVVIGILAAITIVSYTGVTAKANTAAAQSNASSVQSIVNAYYTDNQAGGGNGSWPGTATAINTYAGLSTALATKPYGLTINLNTFALTSVNGRNNVSYMIKGTTGGCIAYFNFGTSALNFYYVGDATAGTEGSGGTLGQITACA
jgi:type IV pilus assembly protein PilA